MSCLSLRVGRVLTRSQTVKGKHLHFSTLELAKTNQRMQDNLEEIFILSDQVLEDVLESIRHDIASLFHICEAIAMLDMIARCSRHSLAQRRLALNPSHSFAKAASMQTYVRPEFTDTLAIKSALEPCLLDHRVTLYAQMVGIRFKSAFASLSTASSSLSALCAESSPIWNLSLRAQRHLCELGCDVPDQCVTRGVRGEVLTRCAQSPAPTALESRR